MFRPVLGTCSLISCRLELALPEKQDVQSKFLRVVSNCWVGPSGFGV